MYRYIKISILSFYNIQGWDQLHEDDYDCTVITHDDYDYDYSEKSMITIMITES